MNGKQVAQQLVRLAKELSSARETKLQKEVAKRIDKAYELIYQADILLSNCYEGDKSSPNDKAVKEIRFGVLRPALKEMGSLGWSKPLSSVTFVPEKFR